MAKYQKRVRLKEFSYKGQYRYFVTIVVDRKRKIFIAHEIVEPILKVLKDSSDACLFIIWAYCFMPDHFHVLTEGKTPDSYLRNLISKFKQKTAYELKKSYQEKLWQENYYEHVLRNDEDTIKTARYIFENPLKRINKECVRLPLYGFF